MSDTLFRYGMVTDYDVKLYNAIPGTMKITDIKATDRDVVSIPETIDGLPVTYYEDLYFGPTITIKKLIIPKTLVTLATTDLFPNIADELAIDKDNPEWSTDGVSLLSKDGTKLIRMCQRNKESYSIPDGVTTICVGAFKCNRNIEVTIPDSVTTVETHAFEHCYSLKTIHGGKNIVDVAPDSFKDTEWYKNPPVLIQGTTLLRYDTMEENVVVPEGVEVIGSRVFSFSRDKKVKLETVTLPSTLREIEDHAFANQTNLKSINFPKGLRMIKEHAFSGCQSLTEICLPEAISEIGCSAFAGCSSLSKLAIPHAVSCTLFGSGEVINDTIAAFAFRGCTSLEHIEIPEGTVTIGASAFDNCSSLKSIQLPSTVKKIEDKAFANCFELEQLFLPASCAELGRNVLPHIIAGWVTRSAKFHRIDVDPQNEAFRVVDGVLCSKNGDTIIACPSQYKVTDYFVPDGVKEILPSAFEGCENIKRIVFSQTVEKNRRERICCNGSAGGNCFAP